MKKLSLHAHENIVSYLWTNRRF